MAPLTQLIAVLAGLATLATAAPADTSESTPAIKSVTFSGNGCPQSNSPRVTESDSDGLSFSFDDFQASTYPAKSRTANCQAHINTAGVGAGWQVAVSEVLVTGKGKIAAGDSLDHFTTVFFSQQASDTVSSQGTFRNGKSVDSSAPEEIRAAPSTLWSSCTTRSDGDILNVNFRVALLDQGASNFDVKSENSQGPFRHQVAAKWVRYVRTRRRHLQLKFRNAPFSVMEKLPELYNCQLAYASTVNRFICSLDSTPSPEDKMPKSKRPPTPTDDSPSDDELIDTTARLELHSRRTDRKQKKNQKRLEKLASRPKVIMDLPHELLIDIFSLVRPSDMYALMRVNRPLHDFIRAESETISRRIISLRYPCLQKCFRLPARLADLDDTQRAAVKADVGGGQMRLVAQKDDQQWERGNQPQEEQGRQRSRGWGRTWRLYNHPSHLPHVGRPDPDSLCDCVTCTIRWIGLNIIVDFAYWQSHLDAGEPIPMFKSWQAPRWNTELVARHAAIVNKAVVDRDPLWYARILELHLATTVRSIRRHAANKGNKRRRYLLTDEDARSETDAFLERSGPPTIDWPYHRDTYYMLEAYVPNRSWSGDEKKYLYVPAEQHEREVQNIIANTVLQQPRGRGDSEASDVRAP
ncbi:hypothetical protein PpBr36_03793 [Pyricularia pennisetigena]|uniref:hypothetical protein n=1 Tax=Pyricularia pennisetigena TaxID=1578925 RepID=UPI001152DF57|nr:hypothetical protein PpBr36_03793 [Pyricularia pennisetigena]TLS30380.1 hypothetical protein PpBr36_03793 [Pyricularia pennisetigena]